MQHDRVQWLLGLVGIGLMAVVYNSQALFSNSQALFCVHSAQKNISAHHHPTQEATATHHAPATTSKHCLAPEDGRVRGLGQGEERGYYDVVVVGAGLSGAVLAERYATQRGARVLVLEQRDHVGGNCHDYVDGSTGIRVSTYGLHMFHTDDREVWEYVNGFGAWQRWDHQALASVDGLFVPLPVNLLTVNALTGQSLVTEEEMDEWLRGVQEPPPHGGPPRNSEEVALARVGRTLYEKLFQPYTIKQWDRRPSELAPEVMARIPLRRNADPRYFTDRFQALPRDGYTALFERMLQHPNITVRLGVDYFDWAPVPFGRLYFTGPIDRFFPGEERRLEYRSLRFEKEIVCEHAGYVLPASQVNYPSLDVPFTRAVEYKWFLHQASNHSVVVREFSSEDGEPYYPVLTPSTHATHKRLQSLAVLRGDEVHFVGRLANFKYFNMDAAIANALAVFKDTSAWLLPQPCLTYAQRYARCAWIEANLDEGEQRALFALALERAAAAQEVAVLRMNRQSDWSQDYRYGVCAFVLEASRWGAQEQRRPVLHVTSAALAWVPEAFRDLVVELDDQAVLQAIPAYKGGHAHGHVAVAHLLLTRFPSYRFLWCMEEDVRVIGAWHEVWRAPGDDDVVFWRGRVLQYEHFEMGVWNQHYPENYQGGWSRTIPALHGEWTMGFGLSARHAVELRDRLLQGTFHLNQEIDLITGARLQAAKVRYDDIRSEWECCTHGEAERIYREWKQGGGCHPSPFLLHAVKERL